MPDRRNEVFEDADQILYGHDLCQDRIKVDNTVNDFQNPEIDVLQGGDKVQYGRIDLKFSCRLIDLAEQLGDFLCGNLDFGTERLRDFRRSLRRVFFDHAEHARERLRICLCRILEAFHALHKEGEQSLSRILRRLDVRICQSHCRSNR